MGAKLITDKRPAKFWNEIESDPGIATATLGNAMSLAELAAHPSVSTFTGPNGGYLAIDLIPPQGRFVEIHSIFRPAGWGREALQIARETCQILFERGVVLITTFQPESEWRSKPPASFGFRPISEFVPIAGFSKNARTFILTKDMWLSSPASKRIC